MKQVGQQEQFLPKFCVKTTLQFGEVGV